MNKILRVVFFGIVIGLLLTGCGQVNTAPTETVNIGTQITEVPTMTSTSTPAPPLLMLLAGAESDPATMVAVRADLEQIALERGMAFEHRQSLSLETAPENLQLVVALPPVSDLTGIAAALPESKFVAFGVPGVSSGGNLVAVGGEQALDFQAFLSGYIAAVQSDDWRVGLIYMGDESGRAYHNAFISGVVYFCGFCNPYFPPYYEYPVYYEIPVGSGSEIFQLAADDMIAKGVNTIHLAPGAQIDTLFQYLAERNLRFVGTEAPPAGLEANWIASVVSSGEVDLRQVIAGVMNGQEKFESSSSIQITYTGLSDARLLHFADVLQQLENGVIDPQGVDIE